jgi:subtilisin family serine protease
MDWYNVFKQRGARHRPGQVAVGAVVSFILIGILAGCNEEIPDPTAGLMDRSLRSDAAPAFETGLSRAGGAGSAATIYGDDTPDNEPAEGTYVAGRLLVKFKPGATENDKQKSLNEASARISGEIPQLDVKIIELPPNASETAQAKAFAGQPNVEFAELNRVYEPALIPNDPWYADPLSPEWHLPKIACPQAWDTTIGSSNVVIAILDTGVNPAHVDLTSKLVPGWNVLYNNTNTSDVNGHGTSIAGIVGASTNNGTGVASVTWTCKIMPIVVGDAAGWTTDGALAQGLSWAADHGARIANMSFTMLHSATLLNAAQYFQQTAQGVVTMSAGNTNTFDPAPDDPPILNVSATDHSDLVPTWSTTGNCIDLAAPGLQIITTGNSGGYVSATGTSCSAPIVAGVAALMVSVNPSLTAQQIQDHLKQSADKVGPYAYGENGRTGWNHYYGYGRVNASRAVQAAGGSPPSTGACCVSGSCLTGLTQTNCLGQNGAWQGAGTSSCTNCVPQPGDTTPPTTSITSPANGSSVAAATTVTVQANASDNSGVVAYVDLYVAGTKVATDTSSPYSFLWSTGSTLGQRTLQTRAYDAAGNVGSSSQITVNVVDTTPPTCSVTSPAGGSTVSGTVSVSASASDNLAVASVSLYVDGSLLPGATDTLAPYAFSWNTTGYSNGTHTLQARAVDTAGNTGNSSIISVTVNNTAADTTPPTVVITSPPNGASVTKFVSVTVNTGDNVGVTRVELYVDGAIKATSTAAPFTTKWNSNKASRGAHTMQCRAYDARGNVGYSQTITVYR